MTWILQCFGNFDMRCWSMLKSLHRYNCFRVVRCTFIHITKMLYWMQIWWLGRRPKHSELILRIMEAVWDLCLVTEHIVPIIRWVNCCCKGMYVVSNNTEKVAVAFKQCSIAINGSSKQTRNLSWHHYTTTTTSAWTFDTTEVGAFMLFDARFWNYHLSSTEIKIH